MKHKWSLPLIAAVAMVAAPLSVFAEGNGKTLFIPVLVYRTGAFAPSGIPIANGFADYFAMLNARDGGLNGFKIVSEECETEYKTDLGVECYEKLKKKAPVVLNPFSTGITYQLIPKAPVDKMVIHSMGYGMTAAADGNWFPWVFNFPMTYWSQASAMVKYIGQQEGGLEKLKGKKIAHVYHNSPYGKEANPTLETLAKQYGFELIELAVDTPGQEQKATWLQIRRANPAWVYVSGWGVMNQVAIKEAAAVGYPMNHLIGNWWTGSEADVIPAGEAAKGYRSTALTVPGSGFPVHADIFKYVYEKGKGAGPREKVGEALYNRALVNAMFDLEAIRTAMAKFGNRQLTSAEIRWGFEHLNITAKHLEELGMKNFTRPLSVTCANHEGNGQLVIQEWDGKHWKIVSDWIEPMRDVVRPKLEQAAEEEGKKLGYTKQACDKSA